MRLQHMMAMADGYASYDQLDGELDFFFRHKVGERLVFLKVTLCREANRSWTVLVEAQDGELLFEEGANSHKVSLALHQIMQALPDWCKVSSH